MGAKIGVGLVLVLLILIFSTGIGFLAGYALARRRTRQPRGFDVLPPPPP